MIDLTTHGDLLKNLEQNLAIYKESIREVALEILKGKVSEYPIFIAGRDEVNLGRMIIDKEELALEWSIYASTLEEFVTRQIVKNDKLSFFRKQFKDPRKFACIFALLDETAGFIFVPYDA